jgi:uncharacterized FlaG/YvyC family protein
MGIKSKLNKIWDRPSILEAYEEENPLIPKKDPKITEDPLAPPGDPTAPEIEDPDVPLTAPRTQPGSEIQKPTGPLAGDTTLTDTDLTDLEPIPEPIVEPALDATEPAAAQAEQAPAQMTKEDVHEIISNYKEQLDAIFNKDAQASVLKKLGSVVGQIENEDQRNIIQQTLNGIVELGTGLTETLEALRNSIVQGLGIESPEVQSEAPEQAPALDVPQIPDLELEP